MRLKNVLHRSAALAAAACISVSGFSQVALADYAAAGDTLENWVCQVVVQNGDNPDHANLWMNDGVCNSITLQNDQHVVLDPADGTFANSEDVLNFAAIYFSYYGEYEGDAEFDISMTNVTIYSTNYDPIVIADYNSVDAGTNQPSASNDYAVRYDFQDQLDASIRTDVLRNLDRIEFDLYVDHANFSDAPQVEGSAQTSVEGYGEMASAGNDAGVNVFLYALNSGDWAWMQTNGKNLNYQTDEHYVIEAGDSASNFAALTSAADVGLQIGYYNNSLPDDTVYKFDCTFSNVVLNFDGYDAVSVGDFTSTEKEFLDSNYGQVSVLSAFPEGADVAEMLRHLTSIEFDARIDFLGALGVEGVNQPEETTTEAETTPEETTTEEPKETTTEAETTTVEETTTAAATTEAETTAASEESSGSNTAKIVITIVAVVVLFGALGAVAVMYFKKSKQF
jgi:hypothetical protein